MRKRMLCAVIASTLLMTGCQSGPPECSEPQTLEILHDLQQQAAQLLAITLVTQAVPEIGFALMGIAPEWMAKAATGMFDDAQAAYTELVKIIATAEQAGHADSGLLQPLKATVDAARWSSVSISGVTTLGRAERRATCSATVSYEMAFPSSKEFGLDGEQGKMIDSLLGDGLLGAARSMKVDVGFSTYYSDDGTHYVELDE